jgi:hypothetical protein
MLNIRAKRLKISTYGYGLTALILIASAILLRLVLTAFGWPDTNSDEGTMGLEAMHIAYRPHELPIFLYGQNYMGVLEAYLGAVFFRLLGISVFSLRLGMILLFALFLITMYFLTRLIYTRMLALFTLVLLALGTRILFLTELVAGGGAVETLLFGSLLLLLSSWLALTFTPNRSPRQQLWRFLAYAGWGFTAGIGLWSHLLVAPFILVTGLILLIFCWAEVHKWALLFLVVGLALGSYPLIVYNLHAAPGQNSWDVFLQLRQADVPKTPDHFLFAKQIIATLLYSLPIATGLNTCSWQNLPLFAPVSSQTLSCSLIQGSWSLVYLALFTISTILAVRPLWKLWQLHQHQPTSWSTENNQAAILHFVRLMFLTSIAFTIVLFAISPVAALRPWSTRYLIGLLVGIPAILWPLWQSSSLSKHNLISTTWAKSFLVFRFALLALIAGTLLVETIQNFSFAPRAQALNQQQNALVNDLSSRHIQHIYSDYWTCDRLIFQSQEHIICGVLDTDMKPGLNRYQSYYATVHTDPNSAYVFLSGSDFASAFTQKAAQAGQHYQQLSFDGYIVYLPR